MKNLNEIRPGGSEIDSWHPLDQGKPTPKIKKDLLNPMKIYKYKGYRFVEDKGTWFMYLPDKPFIVGTIEFYMEDLPNDHWGGHTKYPQVHGSVIHKRFRRQGLGIIMYKALARKYGTMSSDSTLMDGSFRVWSHGLPDSGGFSGIWDDSDDKFIVLPALNDFRFVQQFQPELYSKINRSERFYYFTRKSLIPDGYEVIEDLSPYRKKKLMIDFHKQFDFIKDAGYSLSKVGTKLTVLRDTKEYTLLDWIRQSNKHKSNQDDYHYDDELRDYNIIDTGKDYTLVYDQAVIKNSSFIYLIYNPKQYTKPYEVVETFKTKFTYDKVNKFLTGRLTYKELTGHHSMYDN